MTTKRLSNIIIITTIAFPVLCWLCCQSLTYDLDGPEKSYFLWLKEGAKFEFVSNKNDTTIFTITKIEKKKRKPTMNIPIVGGGDFFHARTFFYVHCKISGDTQSMKQENGLYIYIEKYNSNDISVYAPLGGEYPYGGLGISSDFKYIDTLSIATRKFTDIDIEQYKNHHIAVNYHLGGVSPISWGIGTLNCLDTLPMERKFTDVEFLEHVPKGWDKKTHGMVFFIWSKRYGLLQYTTADSLVWTRINIEEPTET